MIAIQNAVFLVFLGIRSASKPGANQTDLIRDLTSDGNFVAVAALLSSLAGVGLIALLIYSRRYPIRDYLALSWPQARSAWAAVAGLVVLLVVSDLTTYSLGRPITPLGMTEVYRTAWLPLLLIALLVAAPVGEETLFRGFLYKGIAASRAGPTAAVLVTSAVWALLHISQYDWYAIVTILFTGLYLGFVRYRTGSVTLTIVLHSLSNAIATLEVVIQTQGLI
jgi:membrane protease YdiL (CAAX protease family)